MIAIIKKLEQLNSSSLYGGNQPNVEGQKFIHFICFIPYTRHNPLILKIGHKICMI